MTNTHVRNSDHQWVVAPLIEGYHFVGVDTLMLKGDVYIGPYVESWTSRTTETYTVNDSWAGSALRPKGGSDYYGVYRPLVGGYYRLSNLGDTVDVGDVLGYIEGATPLSDQHRPLTQEDVHNNAWRTLKAWTELGPAYSIWRRVGKRILRRSPGNVLYSQPLPLP